MTHAPQRRRDLGEHGFITVSKASGNRLLPDQARTGVPGRPEAVYEAQHVTTLPGPVETGLGVAAVQSMAFSGRDHPLLVSIPLEEPRVTRDVGLIRPARPGADAGGAAAASTSSRTSRRWVQRRRQTDAAGALRVRMDVRSRP